MYDPTLGRFIQRDPAPAAADPADLYRYARDNPVGLKDPTGKQPAAEQAQVQACCKLLGALVQEKEKEVAKQDRVIAAAEKALKDTPENDVPARIDKTNKLSTEIRVAVVLRDQLRALQGRRDFCYRLLGKITAGEPIFLVLPIPFPAPVPVVPPVPAPGLSR
jgi:hypothetical protein